MDGDLLEPVELAVVDIPDQFIGVVTEAFGQRKGQLIKMVNHGRGRVRLEFEVPSRGLIGFRGQFLTDTRGTGIMNTSFPALVPLVRRDQVQAHRLAGGGPCRARSPLMLSTTCRSAADLFVNPGTRVYEGMIVGENSRTVDLDVNVTKDKKLTNMRASTADEAIRLVPVKALTLEDTLAHIKDDELVEITPSFIRLRKRVLAANMR